MIITCPSCETKFNLPDTIARKGAQLRCSICKHVFGLPDTGGQMPGQSADRAPETPSQAESRPNPPQEEPDDSAFLQDSDSSASGGSVDGGLSLDGDFGSGSGSKGRTTKSRKGCLIVCLIAVLLMVGGGVAAWMYAGDLIRAHLPFGLGQTSAPAPAKDMISRITFRGVRQYTLINEKIGPIIVIEGKAVNGFDEPRELIRIEASLFDKDGKLFDKKQQMAGTSVSLFQLQVLGEKELEQALGNRIEILSNNTNVQPGGEVPFMIVFYKSSEAVTEFGVTVTEAKVPPKK